MGITTWLIIIVFVVLVVVVLARRRRSPHQEGQAESLAPRRMDTATSQAPAKISWEDDVASAFSRFGFFKDEAISWMVPIIRQDGEHVGYDAIARKIRNTGDPVSQVERKALGLRANAKVGVQYLGALTEKGREDPMMAAFLVVQWVIHQRTCRRELHELRSLADSLDVTVEVLVGNDGRDCAEVRKLKGKEFSLDTVPSLPLPNCDAEFCRCLYIAGSSTFGEN